MRFQSETSNNAKFSLIPFFTVSCSEEIKIYIDLVPSSRISNWKSFQRDSLFNSDEKIKISSFSHSPLS